LSRLLELPFRLVRSAVAAERKNKHAAVRMCLYARSGVFREMAWLDAGSLKKRRAGKFQSSRTPAFVDER
jgi:hypothetical protein